MTTRRKLVTFRGIFLLFAVVLCLQVGLIQAPYSAAQESEAGENILENPSFETLDGNQAALWEAKERWRSGSVGVTDETARTGDHAVKIQIEDTEDIWLRQTVDVVGGKAYELSAWLKSELVSSGYAKIKVEFYRDTTDAIGWRGQFEGEDLTTSYEDWTQVSTQVEMPVDANIAQVYIRLYGPGVTYYDDVSFHLIEHTPGITLFADRIFYEETMEQGTIQANIYPNDRLYEDKTVSYRIYSEHDASSIVDKSGVAASEVMHIDFDPRLMQLQEPYTVEMQLHAADGDILSEERTTIYRWERPTALREDGTLIVDGEPFFPRIGYHVPEEDYPLVNETINAVQGLRDSPDRYNHERVRQSLDEAHAHGLKVFLPVYPNLWDLEGPQGFDYVTEKVTQLKDHPALIGWMIYDEPNKYEDSIPTLVEDLAEIYRIIRTIDEKNPTYMVVADPPSVPSLGRLTDIVVTDPYPLNVQPISLVQYHVQSAKNWFPEKPVYNILQSFMLPDRPRYAYLPTIKELRNMAYQSVLEGAQGLGYYAFDDPGWDLLASRLYPGMVEFTEQEIPHISHAVLHGTKIDEYRDDDVQWGLWEVEDDWYVIMVNLTEERQTVHLSLPDASYEAEMLALDKRSFPIDDHLLTMELPELASTLVRLTPPITGAGMQEQIQDFLAEGEIMNEQAAHMLSVHLTAINHFEQQGASDKVVQHLQGFRQLLDHQHQQAVMSREAFDTLVRQTEQFEQRVIQSLAVLTVRTMQPELVKGEKLQIEVEVHNSGTEEIKDLNIQLQWPDEFERELENEIYQTLDPGETRIIQFEVEVPNDVAAGTYFYQVTAQFIHKGQQMEIDSERRIDLLPAIEVEAITYKIDAYEGGEHPVTVRLINRANSPTDVMLTGETDEGWTFEFNNPITLAVGQRVEVDGMLYIPDTMEDGQYTLTLHAHVEDGRIQSVDIPVTLDRNLVRNSSFEDYSGERADVWRANENWSSGHVVTDADAARTGDRGIKMETDSTANYWVMQDKVPVQGGETYELSAWLKSEIGPGGRAMMKIEYYHNQGTLKEVWSDEFGSYENWEKVTLISEAPVDANAARVFIRLFGPGTAYYDDVSFRMLFD